MDASQFLSALMAIVVIDLVLAGDNAIVIALAARRLPARLQKRAIVWGTAGAVVVRSSLTVVVVWLLKIPGLLLAGGLLLVWIAWRLLDPDEGNGGHADAPAATTFWGAMRTIVIADAIMGLDNVLGVAGAAHGNYLLVVLGLLISIPIVVWGSTLVLRWVERYPVIVYLGSGVLVWTAAKMIGAEPFVRPWIERAPAIGWALNAMVPALLWLAFVRNHRRLDSRINARLREFAARRPAGASTSSTSPGAIAMTQPLNVLVPVDGSADSLLALRHALAEYRRNHELQLVLLNVQPPLSRHVARFVAGKDRQSWHADNAHRALAAARKLLDDAGVPYRSEWVLGDRAAEICAAAERLQCHHIVIGTARKHSLTRMLQDSTTHQVLERSTIPVEVISGGETSRLERWGLPAGVGAGLSGLVYLALD